MAIDRTEAAALERKSVLARIRDSIDNHFEAVSVMPTMFIVCLVVLVPTILVIHQSFCVF